MTLRRRAFLGAAACLGAAGERILLPGQAAHDLPHGRLHFAGEHTASALRGIEGAMESGERAAREVLAR